MRSNEITLWVQGSNIVYKPISVESRQIFTAGDADDPWLFVVKELNTEAVITADISITDRAESPKILHEQRNIQANNLEDKGETVVGFGPSLSAGSSWAAITATLLRITVVVYNNAVEIERRTLDVEKGIAGGIYSWRDLQNMKEDLAGDYVLQNNIDFPAAGMYGFQEAGFEPIGNDGTAFSGSLDGGGYSIRGLIVDNAELDYAGLFGKIEVNNADAQVVKNLVMMDPHINANAIAGTIVGYLKAGTIMKVAVRSTVETSGVWTDGFILVTDIDDSTSSGYAGGLVGALKSGRVLQCLSEVTVTGLIDSVGGLVGYNTGTVTGYATGDVLGDYYVGGLVGYNTGTVTGYATGAVSGDTNVGGLVGKNNGTVTGYATGNVLGERSAGGLVGVNDVSGIFTGYARGTVSLIKLYSTYGLLAGSGRGVGKGYYSLAESSFVERDKYEGTGVSGKPLSMKEETTQEAFSLLDFINGPWRWVSDGQWPAVDIGLFNPKEEQPTERRDSTFLEDTCVTVEANRPEYSGGIYQIDSWQELQWMENCLYASYRLIADITIPSPGEGTVLLEGFNPVGNSINPFTGTFDGGGYSISGLRILQSGNYYVGLFGYIFGGEVVNLHIEHSGIEGKDYVGTVAGVAMYAKIEEVSMESESTVEVSGTGSKVGGLVGYNSGGTITGYVTGAISGGTDVGGLVGWNGDGSVIGYATGAVSGDVAVGGLVGNNKGGTVTGYVAGTVTATSNIGGLTGLNEGGIITGYATGAVSGDASVGGLAGWNGAGSVTGYAMGSVSGTGKWVNSLVGNNYTGGTVTGYWDQEATSNGTSGIGITSTENIYYYTAASENPGREQNKYYDKGTGTDPNTQDAEDAQIFNDGDFPSIFELPEKDRRWPKLKQSFTVGGKVITLSDAIYNAQEDIVHWEDTTTNTE